MAQKTAEAISAFQDGAQGGVITFRDGGAVVRASSHYVGPAVVLVLHIMALYIGSDHPQLLCK
jgi:hypothetical protein